jgi:hypothetical protein
MPRRQLIVPKREEALAFAKGDSLLLKNQASEQSKKQIGKPAGEPIFARISPDVYEGVCTALAKAKAKKTGPRKLQQLVDEALREWLEKRGYLEQRAA